MLCAPKPECGLRTLMVADESKERGSLGLPALMPNVSLPILGPHPTAHSRSALWGKKSPRGDPQSSPATGVLIGEHRPCLCTPEGPRAATDASQDAMGGRAGVGHAPGGGERLPDSQAWRLLSCYSVRPRVSPSFSPDLSFPVCDTGVGSDDGSPPTYL